MRSVSAAIACLAFLGSASTAQAAQRYAAPTGGGTDCTQAAPCSLTEAMSKAKTDDEVIVGAGTHLLPGAVATPPLAERVAVHGELGGPMPRITGSAATALVSSPEPGSRIEYLEVENRSAEGEALFCGPGGRIERVVAKAIGEESVGISQLNDCTIRDSVVRVDGEDAIGVLASSFIAGDTTTPLRNLTVIATGGGSVGIRSIYGELALSGSYTVDLRNSIVAAATADLFSSSPGKGPGNISVSNSSFDTISQQPLSTISLGAGNQTALLPIFVNPAAGDYREAAGSPTVDGGASDPLLGALDPLGSPRVVGSAPDIGAYEFVPAPVGEIQSLALTPRKFKVGPGGAALSFKDKVLGPAGTTVAYSLSAAATVGFTVKRRLAGRRAGKRCVKKTKGNAKKKKCPLYKSVKGGISHSGSAGQNSFRFSGRIAGRGLKPGAYVLIGKTATTSRTAGFKVLR